MRAMAELLSAQLQLKHAFMSIRGYETASTITVDGVGDLSAYRGTVFLGGLRGHRLVFGESDALRSPSLVARIKPVFQPAAAAIARSLERPNESESILDHLFEGWARTVARLCIGLRRLGSGGSFLITAAPNLDILDVVYEFRYGRLGDSIILQVLDDSYLDLMEEIASGPQFSQAVPSDLEFEKGCAEADAGDRESEVTGAVKLVTSLAAADGLVLLTPNLHVVGFGVKIGSAPEVSEIFDGADFRRKGTKAKRVDHLGFGTRHSSMLRYCQLDRTAVGVVVSQDGNVRIITSMGRSLTLWNDVKLLGHRSYSADVARSEIRWRAARRRRRQEFALGYSATPKTLTALLAE
jgi:hypothetical protein